MSVPLIGVGGLFTILGKLGKLTHDVQAFQNGTFFTDLTAIVTQFDGTVFEDIVASISGNKFSTVFGVNNVSAALQQTAGALVNRMVYNDVPLASDSNIFLSMTELIRQMVASSNSVNDCIVAATAALITVPTVTGDGVIVLSTKRVDGLIEQNLFAEIAPIVCVRDSVTGGAVAGQEGFQFSGTLAQGDPWGYNWPLGSGASATLTAVSPDSSLLSNGDFELFTSNTPTSWIVVAGVPGTDILKSTTHYDGSFSLEFVGGGTAPNLTQLFGATTTALGTIQSLTPLTQYALNFWVKADVVPAAGVLTIDLIDGSNTVINDDSGTPNTLAVALSGITTSFVAHHTSFRLPRVTPSTIKIRMRASTGISAGSNIFIDRMCLTPMTALYSGGDSVVIFSGAIPFIAPDGWEITTTNDRAGSTYGTTWQTVFDRWFDMRGMGLLLPYASGGLETISDSLLS